MIAARRLRVSLHSSPNLFTSEAITLTAEQSRRFGGTTRLKLTPLFHYSLRTGQWRNAEGRNIDERQIRTLIIRALTVGRQDFVGADIALALDLLRADMGVDSFESAVPNDIVDVVANDGAV